MQFDLDNSKNDLQYQLSQLCLAIERFADEFARIVKPLVASVIPYIIDYWDEYQRLQELGAKANPKVAFLAYHAKTQRARIKNLKRLYKIGCLIEKGGA